MTVTQGQIQKESTMVIYANTNIENIDTDINNVSLINDLRIIQDEIKKYKKVEKVLLKNVNVHEVQNWVKTFDDCTINVYDAACGAGKTYQMLQNVVVTGGRWLYVCDTIKNIKERDDEFRSLCAKQNVRNFHPYQVYYNDGKPVADQIDGVLTSINAKSEWAQKAVNAGARRTVKNVIIFITSAALQIIDSSQFNGFNLVIDEAYEVVSMFEKKWNVNIKLADQYFIAKDTDSDYYQILPTELGLNKVANDEFDDFDQHMKDILKSLSKQYSTMWCHKNSWDKRSIARFTFWVVSSPEFIRYFDNVWLMGDDIVSSPIYNVWLKQHKLKFNFLNLQRPRLRRIPLQDRGKIYYFAENRQASINQFKKGDSPLLSIVNWLGENIKDDPFIIAQHAGDKDYTVVDIISKCKNAEVISLKATGINTLQHHTMCVWLGALKLSGQDQEIMKTIFDIDVDMQIRWREYNPLYQFVMRTALRNYDSDSFVKIYVFDRYQAEYLQERTGMPIELIPNVIAFDGMKKGGRPKKADAKTNAERQREFRARKAAEITSCNNSALAPSDATKTPYQDKAEVVSVAPVKTNNNQANNSKDYIPHKMLVPCGNDDPDERVVLFNSFAKKHR